MVIIAYFVKKRKKVEKEKIGPPKSYSLNCFIHTMKERKFHMTEKELLYLSDILSHAQLIEKNCDEVYQKVQDTNVKSFVSAIKSECCDSYHDLASLLQCERCGCR